MTTLTFKLQIEEQLALAYRSAKKEDKLTLKKQVNQFIEGILREHEKERFYRLIAELHEEAASNGLTEEIIDEILAEDE
jgi:uncharacterized protein (UPF0335 family)